MGFLDNLIGKRNKPIEPIGEDGLPNMEAESGSLADAAKVAKAQVKDFRVRENEATHHAENEGLPSVNRRKGGNKLVTILGFIFILGAAAALIVAVNGDKLPKKKKKAQEEQISNNLPAIVIPAAPPPINVTPNAATQRQSAQGPAIPGMPDAKPIALQSSKGKHQTIGPNGKPPLDWIDRKMGGTLLVNQQSGGSFIAATGNGIERPVTGDSEISQPQAFAAPGSRPASGKNELAAKLESTITNSVSASMLSDRNFLITKGTTLDCALETALDSSVPGLTTCRLTRDVYSDNGQVLLLDRGSQLVGEYQGGLKQGQVRLFVLWTRAKTPNGVIVSLNSPGTDALGRSGLDGWVDNHFAERFGAAILMSFIKDSVTALLAKSGGTTNVYGGTITGGDKIVEKILDSSVNIPPTIVKNQGDHIQVMVARDLDFSGVYGLQVKK